MELQRIADRIESIAYELENGIINLRDLASQLRNVDPHSRECGDALENAMYYLGNDLVYDVARYAEREGNELSDQLSDMFEDYQDAMAEEDAD